MVENNLEHSDVFYWWQSQKLNKYPSSLYITVKSYRQMKQDLENLSLKPLEDLENTSNRKNPKVGLMLHKKNLGEDIKTVDIDYHTYKLPNKCIAELDSYDEGTIVMKFSNKGLYLAAAVVMDYVYTILVYSVSFV